MQDLRHIISTLRNVILLMRPRQWIKQMFIFMPLFFSRNLTDINRLIDASTVFIIFSLVSAAIYSLNDIRDRHADRLHPRKRLRPIASKAISIPTAIVVMCASLVTGICFTFCLPAEVRTATFVIIAIYLVLNLAYCMGLKRVALVDVFIIAIGFVLRIVVGGVATDVWLSHWIVLMTFLLALFLALAKRRDDVVLYNNTGSLTRSNITRYNLDFINQAISIIAAVTIMCYIMYTVSEDVILRFGSQYVYITSVFVLLGIIRYLQLTIVDIRSGSPTRVLAHDRFTQCCLLGWLLTFAIIIYIL